MAKTTRKVATKKSSSAPAAIKPVKQTLTKSALINLLAEENEIPRKTAIGVYTTLEKLFLVRSIRAASASSCCQGF
jgi:hypothetical protein